MTLNAFHDHRSVPPRIIDTKFYHSLKELDTWPTHVCISIMYMKCFFLQFFIPCGWDTEAERCAMLCIFLMIYNSAICFWTSTVAMQHRAIMQRFTVRCSIGTWNNWKPDVTKSQNKRLFLCMLTAQRNPFCWMKPVFSESSWTHQPVYSYTPPPVNLQHNSSLGVYIRYFTFKLIFIQLFFV